jgi:hypothetical protein
MRVSATTAIFNMVDSVRSNAKTSKTLTEKARSYRLKPMATAKAPASTMSIIRNGTSRRKVNLVI